MESEGRRVSPFALQAIYDYIKNNEGVKGTDIANHFCISYNHAVITLRILTRVGAVVREGWAKNVSYRVCNESDFSVANLSSKDFRY